MLKRRASALFPLHSGAGRRARRALDRSERWPQNNLLNTRVLFLVTFYISLSTLQQRKLHALSPPPAARYAFASNEPEYELISSMTSEHNRL